MPWAAHTAERAQAGARAAFRGDRFDWAGQLGDQAAVAAIFAVRCDSATRFTGGLEAGCGCSFRFRVESGFVVRMGGTKFADIALSRRQ
jgi:hypothetical protein